MAESVKKELVQLFDHLEELQELAQSKNNEILDVWQIGYEEQERLVSMHVSEEALEGVEILFNEDTLCVLKDEYEALRGEQDKTMIQIRGKLNELLKQS